jgi:hypothetical protein
MLYNIFVFSLYHNLNYSKISSGASVTTDTTRKDWFSLENLGSSFIWEIRTLIISGKRKKIYCNYSWSWSWSWPLVLVLVSASVLVLVLVSVSVSVLVLVLDLVLVLVLVLVKVFLAVVFLVLVLVLVSRSLITCRFYWSAKRQ